MKKILGLMLLCGTMCLSSCSGCSSSNDQRDNSIKVGKYTGKYTSPDGSRQTRYKGSIEQQRDLEAIDAYFNEHGWD